MKNENDNQGVRSLERGLDILLCFLNNTSSLSLTQIADYCDLSKTTCLRLLNTLVKKEILQKNSQRRYSLGYNMFSFINSISGHLNLQEISNPVLEIIRNIYNETASLYVRQGSNRVCVSSVESHHPLRRTVSIGEILPISQGAVGEIFLAYMDKSEREEILQNFDIQSDLNLVRKNGYSINDAKQEEGVLAIAAPIFNAQKNIIASISISGPNYRLKDKVEEITKSIVFYSNSISSQLGYRL